MQESIQPGSEWREGERKNEPRAAWVIRTIIANLNAEPSKCPTRDKLARETRMSASHFTRTFKAVTRKSPTEYLIILKKEQVRQLLADPTMAIKEVAERCGFQNQNHFSAWFRRHFKLSPSAYRARIGRK